jgi:hypothetical protein
MVDAVVPRVSFDWLGTLPSLARQARDEQELRSMGAPDTSSIKKLEEAASRYFALGTPEGTRIGTILLQQAGTRRGIEQRGAEFAAEQANRPALIEALKGITGRGGGAPAALPEPPPLPAPPPPGPQTQTETPTPAPVAQAPQGTPPVQLAGSVTPLPIQPGPQAGMPNAAERIQGYGNPAVPMITPQTPQGYDNINRQFNATPPGPRGAEVRPETSEAILARAEDQPIGGEGTPVATRPVQLAGPAPIGAPPAAAPAPRAPSTVRPPTVITGPDDFKGDTEQRIGAMWQYLAASGRRTTPVTTAIQRSMTDLMNQSKYTADQKQYLTDYIQDIQAGRTPPASMRDWLNEQKDLEPRLKEMRENYQPIADKARSAEDRKQVLQGMQAITQNPAFNGAFYGTPTWDSAMRVANGMAQVIKSHGGPDYTEQVKNLTSSTGYRELFDAMSKQLVSSSQPKGLGGQSFSSTDREYMDKTIPNIDQSPAGRALLIKVQLARADRDIQALDVADKVREERGTRTSVTDINKAMRKFGEENPLFKTKNGELTDLGDEIQGQLKAQGRAKEQARRSREAAQAIENQRIRQMQDQLGGYGIVGDVYTGGR